MPRRMSVTPVASHTEPRSEPGSSPLQQRNHTRQRRLVNRAVNDHPPAAGQYDLHPARRRLALTTLSDGGLIVAASGS